MKIATALLAALIGCGLDSSFARHAKHHGHHKDAAIDKLSHLNTPTTAPPSIFDVFSSANTDVKDCPHYKIAGKLSFLDLDDDNTCTNGEEGKECVLGHCRVCSRVATSLLPLCNSTEVENRPMAPHLNSACVDQAFSDEVWATTLIQLMGIALEPTTSCSASKNQPKCVESCGFCWVREGGHGYYSLDECSCASSVGNDVFLLGISAVPDQSCSVGEDSDCFPAVNSNSTVCRYCRKVDPSDLPAGAEALTTYKKCSVVDANVTTTHKAATDVDTNCTTFSTKSEQRAWEALADQYDLQAVMDPACDSSKPPYGCFNGDKNCRICKTSSKADFENVPVCKDIIKSQDTVEKQVAMSADGKQQLHRDLWSDAGVQLAAMMGTAVGVAILAAMVVHRVRRRRHNVETRVPATAENVADEAEEESKEEETTTLEDSE